MQLDHLSYAAGPEGLRGTADRLSELLGEEFVDGGIHPRFGTSNMTLPLTDGRYLEVVEVLDHPASDKAPFGQAVRARTNIGGGWLAWVVRVEEIETVEKRLERKAVQGNRHRPDGAELLWKQIGLRTLLAEPALPFFVQWESPEYQHPSCGATGRLGLSGLEIAGNPDRVAAWLDTEPTHPLGNVAVDWISGRAPGILSATFVTPEGAVRI